MIDREKYLKLIRNLEIDLTEKSNYNDVLDNMELSPVMNKIEEMNSLLNKSKKYKDKKWLFGFIDKEEIKEDIQLKISQRTDKILTLKKLEANHEFAKVKTGIENMLQEK